MKKIIFIILLGFFLILLLFIYMYNESLRINEHLQKRVEQEVSTLVKKNTYIAVTSVIIDIDNFVIKAFAFTSNNDNDSPQDRFTSEITYLPIELGPLSKPINDAGNVDFELNQFTNLLPITDDKLFDNKNVKDMRFYRTNFIQIVKAYSAFYSHGYIAYPMIGEYGLNKRKILSQKQAEELKKEAEKLFQQKLEFEGINGVQVKMEYDGKIVSAFIYMKSFQEDGHNYLQAFLIRDYYLHENLENSPYRLEYINDVSSANQYIEAIIYSKKNRHKIGKVIEPLTQYQANKGKATAGRVEGIYQGRNGNYYIDAITTEGTPLAKCNACQTANVDTYQVTQNGLKFIKRRPYDFDTYRTEF